MKNNKKSFFAKFEKTYVVLLTLLFLVCIIITYFTSSNIGVFKKYLIVFVILYIIFMVPYLIERFNIRKKIER